MHSVTAAIESTKVILSEKKFYLAQKLELCTEIIHLFILTFINLQLRSTKRQSTDSSRSEPCFFSGTDEKLLLH